MKIGIIDADFCNRKKHRFPNLVCMKLSGFHKENGDDVSLLTDTGNIKDFDKVYVSKVFTDTPFPEEILNMENVEYGGTGFFYDVAPPLPYEIEHHMPDYSLYLDHIGGGTEFKFYRDYSIGFLTRGCFRKCSFCVNRNSERAQVHSNLDEFYDPARKKICLLDDNFLACGKWQEMLQQLKETGKPFVFKQGLDERLLTPKKCKELFSSKYDGEFIFAFDDINDYELIREKLFMIREHTDKICKFYVLCGFDRTGKYDYSFWENDIVDVFRRIELLRGFCCLPYIMRHENYNNSPYRGMYINLARWCNQPSLFKKLSFYEFCTHEQNIGKSPERYMNEFLADASYLEDKHLFAHWGD